MRTLDPIVRKLAEAQTTFLRAADEVPVEMWMTKPRAEEWSASELVAHLVMVERSIVSGANRVTANEPLPVSALKRLHLPLWLVRSRIVKRKSPIPLDQALEGTKTETLRELRATRELSVAFLENTKNRDLRAYCWKHPFLGMLNLYEWFEMIAAHQLRHTKQIKEIAERLPKVG